MLDALWDWLISPASSYYELGSVCLVFAIAFYFIGGVIFHRLGSKMEEEE